MILGVEMICQNSIVYIASSFFLKDLHFCTPYKTIPPRANPERKIQDKYGHPPSPNYLINGLHSYAACPKHSRGVLLFPSC